jgi:DNA-binding GntR family transcriptional regulator
MLYESMFRHPEMLSPSLEREYLEHRAIAEAIASGDGDQAAAKIVEHMHNLGKELELFLEISGELIRDKERQIASLWMGKASIENQT